jgi:hypothetical protein
MCESYIVNCECGSKKAELFFGKMLLHENAVTRLFCPDCSRGHEDPEPHRVWDNGWVLELNMDIVGSYSSSFGMSGEDLTAEWIFDSGYVTWVGITPDDSERRNREREQIRVLAQTDMAAYLKAMKEWGMERERRFSKEGWRKMRT